MNNNNNKQTINNINYSFLSSTILQQNLFIFLSNILQNLYFIIIPCEKILKKYREIPFIYTTNAIVVCIPFLRHED